MDNNNPIKLVRKKTESKRTSTQKDNKCIRNSQHTREKIVVRQENRKTKITGLDT